MPQRPLPEPVHPRHSLSRRKPFPRTDALPLAALPLPVPREEDGLLAALLASDAADPTHLRLGRWRDFRESVRLSRGVMASAWSPEQGPLPPGGSRLVALTPALLRSPTSSSPAATPIPDPFDDNGRTAAFLRLHRRTRLLVPRTIVVQRWWRSACARRLFVRWRARRRLLASTLLRGWRAAAVARRHARRRVLAACLGAWREEAEDTRRTRVLLLMRLRPHVGASGRGAPEASTSHSSSSSQRDRVLDRLCARLVFSERCSHSVGHAPPVLAVLLARASGGGRTPPSPLHEAEAEAEAEAALRARAGHLLPGLCLRAAHLREAHKAIILGRRLGLPTSLPGPLSASLLLFHPPPPPTAVDAVLLTLHATFPTGLPTFPSSPSPSSTTLAPAPPPLPPTLTLLNHAEVRAKRRVFSALALLRAERRGRRDEANRALARALQLSALARGDGDVPWEAEVLRRRLRLWHRVAAFERAVRRARDDGVGRGGPLPTFVDDPALPLPEWDVYLARFLRGLERGEEAEGRGRVARLRRAFAGWRRHHDCAREARQHLLRALRLWSETALRKCFVALRVWGMQRRATRPLVRLALAGWRAAAVRGRELGRRGEAVAAGVGRRVRKRGLARWRVALRQQQLVDAYAVARLQGQVTTVAAATAAGGRTGGEGGRRQAPTAEPLHLSARDACGGGPRGGLMALRACLLLCGDPGRQSLLVGAWAAWARFARRRRAWRDLRFLHARARTSALLRRCMAGWRACVRGDDGSERRVPAEEEEEESALRGDTDERLDAALDAARTGLGHDDDDDDDGGSTSSSSSSRALRDALLGPAYPPFLEPLDGSAQALVRETAEARASMATLRRPVVPWSSSSSSSSPPPPDPHRRLRVAAVLARAQELADQHRVLRVTTPLHRAADAGDEGTVRALLLGGADATAADAEGSTPLHLAARGLAPRFVGLAVLLVEGGAWVCARDDAGRTAADVAANEDVRALLVRHEERIGAGAVTRRERRLFREEATEVWGRALGRRARKGGRGDPLTLDGRLLASAARVHVRERRQVAAAATVAAGVAHSSSSAAASTNAASAAAAAAATALLTLTDGDPLLAGPLSVLLSRRLAPALRFFEANGIRDGPSFARLVTAQARESRRRAALAAFTAERARLLLANADVRDKLGAVVESAGGMTGLALPRAGAPTHRDATARALALSRLRETTAAATAAADGGGSPRPGAGDAEDAAFLSFMVEEYARSSVPDTRQLVRVDGFGRRRSVRWDPRRPASALFAAVAAQLENPGAPSPVPPALLKRVIGKGGGTRARLFLAALGEGEGEGGTGEGGRRRPATADSLGSAATTKVPGRAKLGVSDDAFSAKLLLADAEDRMRRLLLRDGTGGEGGGETGEMDAVDGDSDDGAPPSLPRRRGSVEEALAGMFMVQRLRQAVELADGGEGAGGRDPVALLLRRRLLRPSALLAVRVVAAHAQRAFLESGDPYASLVNRLGGEELGGGGAAVAHAPRLFGWDLVRARLGLGYRRTSGAAYGAHAFVEGVPVSTPRGRDGVRGPMEGLAPAAPNPAAFRPSPGSGEPSSEPAPRRRFATEPHARRVYTGMQRIATRAFYDRGEYASFGLDLRTRGERQGRAEEGGGTLEAHVLSLPGSRRSSVAAADAEGGAVGDGDEDDGTLSPAAADRHDAARPAPTPADALAASVRAALMPEWMRRPPVPSPSPSLPPLVLLRGRRLSTSVEAAASAHALRESLAQRAESSGRQTLASAAALAARRGGRDTADGEVWDEVVAAAAAAAVAQAEGRPAGVDGTADPGPPPEAAVGSLAAVRLAARAARDADGAILISDVALSRAVAARERKRASIVEAEAAVDAERASLARQRDGAAHDLAAAEGELADCLVRATELRGRVEALQREADSASAAGLAVAGGVVDGVQAKGGAHGRWRSAQRRRAEADEEARRAQAAVKEAEFAHARAAAVLAVAQDRRGPARAGGAPSSSSSSARPTSPRPPLRHPLAPPPEEAAEREALRRLQRARLIAQTARGLLASRASEIVALERAGDAAASALVVDAPLIASARGALAAGAAHLSSLLDAVLAQADAARRAADEAREAAESLGVREGRVAALGASLVEARGRLDAFLRAPSAADMRRQLADAAEARERERHALGRDVERAVAAERAQREREEAIRREEEEGRARVEALRRRRREEAEEEERRRREERERKRAEAAGLRAAAVEEEEERRRARSGGRGTGATGEDDEGQTSSPTAGLRSLLEEAVENLGRVHEGLLAGLARRVGCGEVGGREAEEWGGRGEDVGGGGKGGVGAAIALALQPPTEGERVGAKGEAGSPARSARVRVAAVGAAGGGGEGAPWAPSSPPPAAASVEPEPEPEPEAPVLVQGRPRAFLRRRVSLSDDSLVGSFSAEVWVG
jgi:hypothetical protein